MPIHLIALECRAVFVECYSFRPLLHCFVICLDFELIREIVHMMLIVELPCLDLLLVYIVLIPNFVLNLIAP